MRTKRISTTIKHSFASWLASLGGGQSQDLWVRAFIKEARRRLEACPRPMESWKDVARYLLEDDASHMDINAAKRVWSTYLMVHGKAAA